MSASPDMCTSTRAANLEHPSPEDLFDPSLHFDRWLADLQAGQKEFISEASGLKEGSNSEIYIESWPGSNYELAFEGELHFDGYSIGNICSPEGTLFLTNRGRIEADIDVAVAVINGTVTGNIMASERVVLDSDARVTGEIHTRALSVRLGAVFDGDCLFIESTESDAGLPRRAQAEAFEDSLVRV